MKRWVSKRKKSQSRGYTLIEVLVAVAIFSLMAAAMLPFLLDVRERVQRWSIEMELDQEALRFFTYLENRNAGVRSWSVEGSSFTLEIGGSSSVKRKYYRLNDHIVETEVGTWPGGSIILCYYVQDFRLIPNGESLQIQITLKKGSYFKTYEGALYRSLEL